MATITADTFLDGGTARTAGEAHAIGNGARLTVRTDSRIHANAPESFTGALGSPTFTDIGGELFVDATAVRWLAFSGVTAGNVPAIGTAITQGGVSGYLLGVWATAVSAPTAVGAACPASGFIKLREVTGGAYAAGAISGLATGAVAGGADSPGWLEVVWDAAVNFVVGRVGKIKSRAGWFELGLTSGAVGQVFGIPTSSSAQTNNFCPGAWVEKYDGAHEALGPVDGYEFWQGLSSAANMWVRTALGFPEGSTDARGKFVKAFGNGQMQFGESATLAATYASVAGQAATYAGIAITTGVTYTVVGNVCQVNTVAAAHLFRDGQQVYLDFTSGTAPDGTYTVTVLDAYNFTVPIVTGDTAGNVTIRPGVTVTFTAHGVHEGEDVYCDFTTGTGVDGTYKVYAVTGANTYNVEYPHTAALTSGNVTCNHTVQITYTAHGHAVGNEVYCDFTSGAGVDGKYVMKAVAANTININHPFSAAITTSNVTLRWTIGHVPAANLRVKISNILWAECATASRATNSVPNATIASRPEFTTTTAGAIDLEGLYVLSGRSVFAQPYSVAIKNCALSETLDISECATALDIDNVGVGQYSAQDARALQLTSNFAGGLVKNVWAQRATLGTTDHATELVYCNGQSIQNLNTGIIGYARSTGIACNILTCQNISMDGVRVFNGNIPIATSVGITLKNVDYNDRYVGKTSPTSPYYAISVGAGCDRITVDGVTFGMNNAVVDCHPYTGVLYVIGATNIKARNVGDDAAYLSTGVWAPNYAGMGIAFVSGGNNNTMKLQRWFLKELRTGLLTTINSDKNVLVEQVLTKDPWLHSAKAARTEVIAWLNAQIKGLVSGLPLTTGQTSVYGTHWLDEYQGDYYGAIILAMNEPTAETAAYWSNPAGVAKFNSAGGIEMRAIGAEAIWEMPYFSKGHIGFANITPVMSGGTIGNYTLTYQIDTGSGWNGTWKTLNTTNLTGETISPTTGFKLKARIVTSTTNSTAITFLRILTKTTLAAKNAVVYPLDTTDFTFTVKDPAGAAITGYEWRLYLKDVAAGVIGSVELGGSESYNSQSYTYQHEFSSATDVMLQLIKEGYEEGLYEFSLSSAPQAVTVLLQPEFNI